MEELEKDKERLEKEKVEVEDIDQRLKDTANEGYNEAGREYKEDLKPLLANARLEGELKGIRETHRYSFLQGYQEGLDKADVPGDHSLRESSVVPLVVLPGYLLHLVKLSTQSTDQLDPNGGPNKAVA